MKKIFVCLCFLLILSGCGSKPSIDKAVEKQTTQIFAMDTVMDLTVYSDQKDILNTAASLISDLEHSLSTTDTASEISRLNRDCIVTLSKQPADLLEQSLGFCEKTNGALDLSIYPVVRAWGFTTDSYQVPESSEINSLLENVDYRRINYSAEDHTVTLPPKMEIDLGSVAKGFAGDQLIQLFKDHDISSALINLGGNVQALGSKPDGSPWRIAVKDPNGGEYLGVLSMSDQAVITSGGYERYFEDDNGNVYWHIIDPSTGYPAKNGIISATAVGPQGAYCDALSTSLFIMGPDKAVEFWRTYQDFDMILVTDDNRVLITPGISDSFQLADNSPYNEEVITNAEN